MLNQFGYISSWSGIFVVLFLSNNRPIDAKITFPTVTLCHFLVICIIKRRLVEFRSVLKQLSLSHWHNCPIWTVSLALRV